MDCADAIREELADLKKKMDFTQKALIGFCHNAMYWKERLDQAEELLRKLGKSDPEVFTYFRKYDIDPSPPKF